MTSSFNFLILHDSCRFVIKIFFWRRPGASYSFWQWLNGVSIWTKVDFWLWFDGLNPVSRLNLNLFIERSNPITRPLTLLKLVCKSAVVQAFHSKKSDGDLSFYHIASLLVLPHERRRLIYRLESENVHKEASVSNEADLTLNNHSVLFIRRVSVTPWNSQHDEKLSRTGQRAARILIGRITSVSPTGDQDSSAAIGSHRIRLPQGARSLQTRLVIYCRVNDTVWKWIENH